MYSQLSICPSVCLSGCLSVYLSSRFGMLHSSSADGCRLRVLNCPMSTSSVVACLRVSVWSHIVQPESMVWAVDHKFSKASSI